MAKDKEKSRRPQTDLESSLKELDEIGRSDFLSLKEGKNVVRILPWKKVFFFKAILHYGLRRLTGSGETAFPCLKMFGEEKCPICKFHEELSESKSLKKSRVGARIRPVTKFYVNVIGRDRSSAGILMLGLTLKMMKTLRGFLEDEDYGDITDPEDGKDVIITREGTGFTSTSYELRVRAKSTPVDYEDWEHELHDLEKEVVKEVDYDFLKKRVTALKNFMEGGEEEEEDEGREKKHKGGKKGEDEDEDDKGEEEEGEDDDKEEEDDKDDDEEDEKPKKHKKK